MISHSMLLGREPINSKWSTDVRFGAHSGLKSDITALPKSAMSGSPTFTCRLVGMPVGTSFGQPSFLQSLLVSRQVFSTSIRAKNVFEFRNTQRGI